MQPAYATKHIPNLPLPFRHHTFHLAQFQSAQSNGTALWQCAQVLALFLADNLNLQRGGRACELGSGVGMTALCLAAMGWDVCATDARVVAHGVLKENIAKNLEEGMGRVVVRELDWAEPLDLPTDDGSLGPPYDLILTADTVYDPVITHHLLRTLHSLASLSFSPSKRGSTSCPVYLCFERRDPALCDRAIEDAKSVWGFSVKKIPHTKLVRAVEKAGLSKADCDDIEIWRMTLHVSPS